MTIQIDSREKSKAIKLIEQEFSRKGIKYYTSKLFVGDYMSLDNPRLIIDRKSNLAELCANVSSVPKKDKDGRFKRDINGKVMTELDRFTAELARAQENGIKLVLLCEHGGKIRNLEDVKQWQNPRLKSSPLAMSGARLYNILYVLSKKYDIDIVFCDKRSTGREIARILGGEL